MAVISCPECGGTVSEHADTCPHCGVDNPGKLKKKIEKQKSGKSGWKTAGKVIGGVVVTGLILNALSKEK